MQMFTGLVSDAGELLVNGLLVSQACSRALRGLGRAGQLTTRRSRLVSRPLCSASPRSPHMPPSTSLRWQCSDGARGLVRPSSHVGTERQQGCSFEGW
jgi:hypothetical protein